MKKEIPSILIIFSENVMIIIKKKRFGFMYRYNAWRVIVDMALLYYIILNNINCYHIDCGPGEFFLFRVVFCFRFPSRQNT